MNELIKTIGYLNIYATEEILTKIDSDALITDYPFICHRTGVHAMIYNAADHIYHAQVDARTPLIEYEVIVAKPNQHPMQKHTGRFKDVVFVATGSDSLLENIVYLGLDAANMQRCKSAVMMASTQYLKWDKSNDTPIKMLEALYHGIERFSKHDDKQYLKDIILSIGNDERGLLETVFK